MVRTRLIAVLLLISTFSMAQTYPETGQTPGSAFPVCGSNTFNQETVPQGSSGFLSVPGCGDYPDVNPFWYTFTCFKTGTLGFVIKPFDLTDDYDWMLFDITGKKPEDVFTDASLVVIGNWSGSSGLTGAKSGGSGTTQCGSNPLDNTPTFSIMPTITEGHVYLLIISHYTETQSGYSLKFNGGTAVITDSTKPHLLTASISCDRKSITVILNKQMRCNSLGSDGSDFDIAGMPGIISGAAGVDCNSQFDMTSLVVALKSPLAPGDYSLSSKKGSDANTIEDDCGTELPVGESVSFKVLPPQPTPFDSLVTPSCAPQVIQLIFSDPIQCSSIAPDGSDFQVTGTPQISIAKAEGTCTSGLSRVIDITFSSPIVRSGSYQVSLVRGSDGNTIINECGVETPPGGQLSFNTRDTVSAAFGYSIIYDCKVDTISVRYQAANGVNSWQWMVDSVPNSTIASPEIPESVFGLKTIQHIVTNGFCSDTVTEVVDLDNTLKAEFSVPEMVCPKDMLSLTNASIGHIVSWNWNFGDGSESFEKDPVPHLFPNTANGRVYRVSLAVRDNLGCVDSVTAQVTKLQSCYITVPNAFTPDGNGVNDFLYPLNAFMATDLEFRVFNRLGQLVFETKDWANKWDGTINGRPQAVGTYVWTLRYTDATGKKFATRGTSVLIR